MTTARSEIAVGTVLDDKYEILELLGVGGMGEVYKARHVHLGAHRCIKVMRPDLAQDDSYKSRFLREAVVATKVHHPNVAAIHDFETLPDGTTYMVSEFIDGITLRQWNKVHGRFDVDIASEIAVQVLHGLEHCHARGLLHRDISADNIMLLLETDDRIVAKIIDLGIAKMKSATFAGGVTTQVGLFVGNPRYSSPEQLGALDDGEELDGRADLYCLGVVLFEMVTGMPPFRASTPQQYAVKHLNAPPPAFDTVTSDLLLPAGFENVVHKAMEKKRTERHANASEFAEALEPFALSSRNTGGADRLHAFLQKAKSLAIEERNQNSERLSSLARTVARGPAEAHAAALAAAETVITPPPPSLTSTPTILTPPPFDTSLPSTRSRRTVIWATVLLLLAISAFVLSYLANRDVDPPLNVGPPPVALPVSMLQVDALPWGRIISIAGEDGRNRLSSAGETPFMMRVPAGRYRVTLASPRDSSTKSCDVVVSSTAPGECIVDFGAVDAIDYLRRVGVMQ